MQLVRLMSGTLTLLLLLLLSAILEAAAVPAYDKSLSIRSSGSVAEHFDQGELVKRVNLALVTASLSLLGGLTYQACTAAIVPAVGATICAVAVVGSLVGALSTLYRGLQKRDEIVPYYSNATGVPILHNYPGYPDGPSVLQQLKDQYNGTALLVSYNDCYTVSCFQVHYSNKMHPTAGLLHKLSVSPRRLSTTKRQTDEQESGSASSDGSEVYGDYIFLDTDTSDENAFGYDGGFPDNLETQVGENDIFTNQGYICFDIEDADDSDNKASSGYIAISQDEPMQDPDDEQSYLSQCQSD